MDELIDELLESGDETPFVPMAQAASPPSVTLPEPQQEEARFEIPTTEEMATPGMDLAIRESSELPSLETPEAAAVPEAKPLATTETIPVESPEFLIPEKEQAGVPDALPVPERQDSRLEMSEAPEFPVERAAPFSPRESIAAPQSGAFELPQKLQPPEIEWLPDDETIQELERKLEGLISGQEGSLHRVYDDLHRDMREAMADLAGLLDRRHAL